MTLKGSTKATYPSAKALRNLEETHFQSAKFPNTMSHEASYPEEADLKTQQK
jgi:hypothetical protein